MNVPSCINLKERFGAKYRVGYEESYYAERGELGRADDPWLQILLCEHGHIYPHGDDLLAASTDKRGSVATRLAALACTTMLQNGDDGINVAFHLDDFDQVAAIMKPRKRRVVSDAERDRLAELSQKHSPFRHRSISEAQETEPESHDDTQAA